MAKCDLCGGTGWYGDQGPGMAGNSEYQPCEQCRPCRAEDPSRRMIELEAWIREALPMLETAACIVIEDSRDRLAEIAGVRAVIEMCPLDDNPVPEHHDTCCCNDCTPAGEAEA